MKYTITLSVAIATASIGILSAGCSSTDSEQSAQTEIDLGESTSTVLSTAQQSSHSQNINNQAVATAHERQAQAHGSSPESEFQYLPPQRATTADQQHLQAQALQKHKHGFAEERLELDLATSVIPNTEQYQELLSNSVVRVADQSTSTFSIDVDTGSYSNIRRMLRTGQLPPENAVRLEEMLNYFDYDYQAPDLNEHPFSITTELASTPWNNKTRLLHVGLQGFEVDKQKRPTANLVFLIDVSGSMSAPNKLGLLKSSIKLMTNELNQNDSVSIVVYAGASGVVLEPTAGDNSRKISHALDQLQAGGSTNGEAGINLAYSLAEQKMSEGSINRIILATDGDFNVGVSDIGALKKLIAQKRESGIALTTLGFGSGNYNDHLMEQLADVGNGNYAYIDTLNEARKVLSEQMSATLMTIAKDVKIQVEFNPAQVSEYRLLGYINRKLANEDFANDKVDAGEIGAGHSVTALYEVALVGEGGERHTPSRYTQTESQQSSHLSTGGAASNGLMQEIAEVRLRYKKPEEDTSQLISRVIERNQLIPSIGQASNNFRFSSSVAGFAQLLRGSNYMNEFGYDDVVSLATKAKGDDRFGYRAEFIQLVDLAGMMNQQNQALLRKTGNDNEG